MQIVFESGHSDAALMRPKAVERVGFVLRRLKQLVRQVKVRMVDDNGPRGGVDKRCQIELRTEQAGTIVVNARAADWHAALNASLASATQVLMRSVKRQQNLMRQGIRRPRVIELAPDA